MAGVSVNVSGMSAVLSNLGALTGDVKGKVQPVIETALQRTYDGSQNDVPVLSGDLKASGAIQVGDLQGSVSYGNDTVKYAIPIELGHHTSSGSFVPAQPYLVPNWLTACKQLQSDLQGIV